MANNFLPKCAPIWGWPMEMTIADFPSRVMTPVKLLDAGANNTTSAAVSVGARSVVLSAKFTDPAATCSITLFTSVGGVDTTVKTWDGVGPQSAIYSGNLEHIDLKGQLLKVQVTNLTAGTVSVFAKPTA